MAETVAKSGLAAVAERAGARVGTVAGWQVVLGYGPLEAEQTAVREGVALADASAVGKLVIQGRAIDDALTAHFGAAPAQPTDLMAFDGGWITRMNRYEYYAVLPLDQLGEKVDALRAAFAGRHAHVTSLTHGRDAIAVIGPRAPETLNKLCALDFHARTFPNHTAQISNVAKVAALIARVDRAGIRSYEIHLDRSYSECVWAALLDAAQEFGGRAVGWPAYSSNGSQG